MSRSSIVDSPAPIAVFGVFGAMIGGALESLMTGVGSGFEDILTGAFVGSIVAMTLILWLRSE